MAFSGGNRSRWWDTAVLKCRRGKTAWLAYTGVPAAERRMSVGLRLPRMCRMFVQQKMESALPLFRDERLNVSVKIVFDRCVDHNKQQSLRM